jgi:oligogalacturonide transport system substrate-binding protein
MQAMEYANEAGAGIGQGTLIRNNEISRIGADMISSVAFGQSTPEEAAKEYIKLVNRKLQELKTAQQ